MWLQFIVFLSGILVIFWFFKDDKLDTIAGKRVLVTGSSEGIGEQMAYHYARLGANVVVTARRLDKLNKVVKECQSISPTPKQNHFAISADMAKLEDTKNVIQQAVQSLGGLDILVLNHAMVSTPGIFTGSPEQLQSFRAVMDVNFRAYVHLTSHALPELLANEGSIIVLNSVGGKFPFAFAAPYVASKHALNGFFRSLKNQFASLGQNVSVTSCTLGYIGTETAMKQMEHAKGSLLARMSRPACPNATALEVVKGGAMRLDDVYTPYLEAKVMTLLYNIYPPLVEFIMGQLLADAL